MEPACLGYLVGIPQLGSDVGSGIVTIENGLQTMAPGTLNDPIHQCQTAQTFEVGIQFVVDALRFARRIEELVAERQANAVEACLCDLLEHVLPVALPQPMRDEGARLKPKPVTASEISPPPRPTPQLPITP